MGEVDVLEIYGAGIASLSNLLYSRAGNDLRIAVLDWQGNTHGSVTIQDMGNPANRVETIALIDAQGQEIATADANLLSIFDSQANNNSPWLQATAASMSVSTGQPVNANALWKASESDTGDTIQSLAFWDSSSALGGGHLEITGQPFQVAEGGTWQADSDGGTAPAERWVLVTDQAFQAGAVSYIDDAAPDGGEWVYALAHDGEAWSNMTAVWLV